MVFIYYIIKLGDSEHQSGQFNYIQSSLPKDDAKSIKVNYHDLINVFSEEEEPISILLSHYLLFRTSKNSNTIRIYLI